MLIHSDDIVAVTQKKVYTMIPNFTRIFPHPLFLLMNAVPEPDIFILTNAHSLILPQNEYMILLEDLKGIMDHIMYPNITLLECI